MHEAISRKIQATHRARRALVYVRQSTPYQVEHHRESQRRQYDLAETAVSYGWVPSQVTVIDEDQGQSGSTPSTRAGFGRLVTAVGGGEVGMVLSLEASRLARNSPDWHNLLYMCRYTQTLISDEHGVYDPADPMDRMILGLRGQFSELELETSIHRLIEGRWSKARRGEFLIVPPAGYDLDDRDELVITSDEAVRQAMELVFVKFDEVGSVRQVLAYWENQGLAFPVRHVGPKSRPVRWMKPVYRMFLSVLHHPIYAGAYAFGRTRCVREIDPERPGQVRTRQAAQPQSEWPVLLFDHHPGYISWERYQDHQRRIRSNQQMMRNKEGAIGPAREGWALLQGLVRCGHCGRTMKVGYGGTRPSLHLSRTLQYRCTDGRQSYGHRTCQVVGGKQINTVVVEAFLEVSQHAGPMAAELALKGVDEAKEASSQLWAMQVEKAEYEAERARRQYDAVEPENRVVARTLEARWNAALTQLEALRREADAHRVIERPLTAEERARAETLGQDLELLWDAPTTTNRDRKQLLRALIEEVQLRSETEHYAVTILWKGGAVTERTAVRRRRGANHPCATPEPVIALVRRLATEFDDAQIARILQRQGQKTAKGLPWSAQTVAQLRNRHDIPVYPRHKARDPREGPYTQDQAAAELHVSTMTISRWLKSGLLPGKQLAPGAPWQIIIPDPLRNKLTGAETPDGWVGLTEAARRLGLSKQQVAHMVNVGKLNAARVRDGARSVWKIDLESATCGKQTQLFDRCEHPFSTEA